MLSVAEAQAIVLDSFSQMDEVSVPLEESANRVLARSIVSTVDLPRFTNSSMDGFAIKSLDVATASSENPVTLEVSADIPAGKSADIEMKAGQAARIMTGAPLPIGADAVVPVEQTDFPYSDTGTPAPQVVRIFSSIHTDGNVRMQGEDVKEEQVVIEKGALLRPAELGIMAMLGVETVQVFRKPRMAIISTGDELIPIDAPMVHGKMYDSNAYVLSALIRDSGGDPLYLGICPDDEQAFLEKLNTAVKQHADLIISTAGVSVGAFDYVKKVIEQTGKLGFWRVNMRPGKPLAFGAFRSIPFIGLPGNPVSAVIGYEIFVRPAIMKMSGRDNWRRPVKRVFLTEPVESDGRESYLRVIIEERDNALFARLTGHQGSGNLFSLVHANGLIILPAGVKSLPEGAEIEAIYPF